MNNIFTKVLYELEEGNDLVLVSIMTQEGSAPRGPGAQMLVNKNGRIFGTIGGGAAEMQCEKYAMTLLGEKRSDEKHFILQQSENNEVGMVCGGNITVWLQFIDSALSFWRECSTKVLELLHKHQPAWFAFNMDGTLPAIVNEEGSTIMGTCAATIPALSLNCYMKTEDNFFMPLYAGDRALIFGGGHCAQALVPVLSRIGFDVTVMDNRPELATTEIFPEAKEVICGEYAKISDYLEILPTDYVIIMTNGHIHDLEVQKQVLKQSTSYVGAIGSKNKVAFINGKLREEGFSEETIQRVHSPIGTAIKAVTPEEIAISIAGEMIYERALLRENVAK